MSAWMLETLVASTVLMALVLLLRRPVTRWFGPHVAYMLWALPAARMILPPLPQGGAAAAILPPELGDMGYTLVLEGPVQAAPESFPWVTLAIAIWLTGMAAFLAVQLWGYIRFRRTLLQDARPMAELDGTGITFLASPAASGPLAFGIWHRYIIVPADFSVRYDADEQELALVHEEMHHRRGDLVANLAALIMLGVHWCNPLAWVAYRAFRSDQELACDAHVLAHDAGGRAHAYGRAILKAASPGTRPMLASLNTCHLTSVDSLKGRLKMLATHQQTRDRITWGMAAVAMVTLSGLALTASGGRAAQQVATVSQQVEETSLTRLAAFLPEAPRAPTPPAPPASPVAEPAPPAPPASPQAPLATVAPVAPPTPPVPPVPPVADNAPHRETRVVTVIRTSDGESAPATSELETVEVRGDCKSGDTVSSESRTSRDGKREHVRILICTKEITDRARMQADSALEKAREQLAKAGTLSDEIRAKVLADLDRQIARLRREAQ